jgi:hypothetical protein
MQRALRDVVRIQAAPAGFAAARRMGTRFLGQGPGSVSDLF